MKWEGLRCGRPIERNELVNTPNLGNKGFREGEGDMVHKRDRAPSIRASLTS